MAVALAEIVGTGVLLPPPENDRLGSWLCENSTAQKIDRTNLSSDWGNDNFLSAVDFERFEKAILLACELAEFLHNQGHNE
jgi:hypothetical protein